jgi:hypothetical protein
MLGHRVYLSILWISNPDISRVREVHLQGIQGCRRSRLLQALDNEANGRLSHARRVNIFEKIEQYNFRYKPSPYK